MKKVLALVLALVILTALSACAGKNNVSTPDEAVESTATQTALSEDSSKETTEESTPTESNSPDSGGSSYSNTSSGSSGGGSAHTPGNSTDTANPTRCTITTGSKGYTAEVGETFTYTCKLKTPKEIEDIQATLTYDSTMLEIVDISFPVLGSGTIYNTELQNMVKFNAINIQGYDFTAEADLVTIDFKVCKKGGTAISTAIEVMTELTEGINGKDYVVNFQLVPGVSIKETINK